MSKIKNIFNKKRKKAQHLVEFVIILPLFIAIFGALLPIIAGAYTHQTFSFALENAVNTVIEKYTKQEDPGTAPPPGHGNALDNYVNNYQKCLIAGIKGVVVKKQPSPDCTVDDDSLNVFALDTKNDSDADTINTQSVFVYGTLAQPVRMFYSVAGKNYYNYAIPINRNYLEPNISIMDNDYFNNATSNAVFAKSHYYNDTWREANITASSSSLTGTSGSSGGTPSTPPAPAPPRNRLHNNTPTPPVQNSIQDNSGVLDGMSGALEG